MTEAAGRHTLTLDPAGVGLAELRAVADRATSVGLSPQVRQRIARGHEALARVLKQDRTVYGINTGFGLLARERISDRELSDLQVNLVRSHCCGTGPLLDDAVVRLIVVLKIVGLSRGHSGVRPDIVAALARLLDHDIYPCIPSKGSVGASGDLAPLAHLAAVLIGEGQARHGGETLAGAEALARAGAAPTALAPKEGLALLNGTQVSTALALHALFAAEAVFAAALVAGAMSVDAVKGSDGPFDARIHDARGQPGQIAVARTLRRLIAGSPIRSSHLACDRVQDPYSIRCQPQVMGACLGLMEAAADTLAIEANAATDNPLVFAEDDAVLSGGNFHAEPVAMAADMLAIAVAEMAALSERRIALMIDPHFSELPAFLIEHGGLNSGFMIAQVTAAALVSENKGLSHPASVDSLPTSANQEDHVSMATYAARRLDEMIDNAAGVVAIELMAAAQGIDFRRPLATSAPLADCHRLIRQAVPFCERDRALAPDIAAIKALVTSGTFMAPVADILPSTRTP